MACEQVSLRQLVPCEQVRLNWMTGIKKMAFGEDGTYQLPSLQVCACCILVQYHPCMTACLQILCLTTTQTGKAARPSD